ncbi:MAG: DUF2892 domain-containing protein [Eubacteriales bacterium]|nr:DUF2892 domain-containing protein [Eubacteriales bacterium]
MMTISILHPTSKRVQYHTDPDVNQAIKEQTICKLYELNNYKSKKNTVLNRCIDNLDKEWDTERVLETNAAVIILISSILGLKRSKAFLIPGIISFFLLQHALQGWCPPLPLIRKIGIRTAEEISNERIALKMMRGDFSEVPDTVEELFERIEK